MGKIQIKFTSQFADDVADLAYFIESKGLFETAEIYAYKLYSFIDRLNFEIVDYAYCSDIDRRAAGLRCLIYRKKYTIVFYQFQDEVIFTEFIPSKLIK